MKSAAEAQTEIKFVTGVADIMLEIKIMSVQESHISSANKSNECM